MKVNGFGWGKLYRADGQYGVDRNTRSLVYNVFHIIY